MNYSFVINPFVKKDISNATSYYKKINKNLAYQFLVRVREGKKLINETPLGFQIKYKNVRTLLLNQFPYHIHYIVNESKMQIIILAIIHAYKNPNNYPAR